MTHGPGLDDQQSFWDEWNASHRTHGIDAFMARQAAEACRHAESLVSGGLDRPLRILEVGCGTGWLSSTLAQHGEVMATDLSEQAIAIGRSKYPNVRFTAGDFAVVDLDGPYDLVVSADTIAHVADQKLFVERIASSLLPGGTFLLMTQNAFVWKRSSYVSPQAKGQLRSWPSLRHLREMLSPSFTITHISSIVPGGDQGVLRIACWLRGGSRAPRLEPLARPALERARIGRELLITATRR